MRTPGLGVLRPALAGLVVLAGGCIDSETVVTVRRDGSGTVRVREYFSPQLTGMLQGIGGAMGGGGGEAPAAGDALDRVVREAVEARARQMGPEVERVELTRGRNAAEWDGYEATFRFADVNRLSVAPPESSRGGDAGPAPAAKGYRFAMKDGQLSVRIPDEGRPDGAPPSGAPPDVPAAPALADPMAAVMASMMRGLHVRIAVRVEGRIVETNAIQADAGEGTVVLLDLPVDRIFDKPELTQAMMTRKAELPALLRKAGIEGVVVEEPGKDVTIRFE